MPCEANIQTSKKGFKQLATIHTSLEEALKCNPFKNNNNFNSKFQFQLGAKWNQQLSRRHCGW